METALKSLSIADLRRWQDTAARRGYYAALGAIDAELAIRSATKGGQAWSAIKAGPVSLRDLAQQPVFPAYARAIRVIDYSVGHTTSTGSCCAEAYLKTIGGALCIGSWLPGGLGPIVSVAPAGRGRVEVKNRFGETFLISDHLVGVQ